MSQQAPSVSNGILCAGVFLVLLLVVGALCGRIRYLLESDVSDVGGADVFVVYTLTAARDGRSLYPSPTETPFVVTQYAPLFYLINNFVNQVFHVRANQPEIVAAVARGISTSAWIGASCLVFLFWRRLKFSLPAALTAAVFTLVSAGSFPFQARPDALEVLCSVSCVLLLWKGGDARGWKSAIAVFLAGMTGCLAAFVKQNGIETLAFVVVAGWAHRRRSIPALFTAGFGLSALATFLPAYEYYGAPLKDHLVDGINNGVNLPWAVNKAYMPFVTKSGFVFAIGIGLAATRLVYGADSKLAMLAGIVATSFAANAIAALKYGSAENYFMEFSVLSVILFGAELQSSRLGPSRPWLTVGFAAFLSMAFAQLFEFKSDLLAAKRLRGKDLTPLVAELDRRLHANPEAYFVSGETRLPLLYPRRSIVGQMELVSICHQRGVFAYRAYFDLIANGRLRYHVIDLRNGPLDKTYRDRTNLEFPLKGFKEVGNFGPYVLLENPRSKR